MRRLRSSWAISSLSRRDSVGSIDFTATSGLGEEEDVDEDELTFEEVSEEELESSDEEEEEEGEEQVPEEPHTGHVETIPYVVQIEEPAHDSSELSDDDKPVTPPCRPHKRVKKSDANSPKRKKYKFKRSILHDLLLKKDKGIVCLSVDVKTASPMIGIVQISVAVFDHKTKKILGYFNEYIDPGDNLASYWDENSMNVHGIQPSDKRIQIADNIKEVWPRFVKFCEKWTTEYGYEKALMIAWSGNAYDLEHLFIVTEDKHKGTLKMPAGMDYFMDPSAEVHHKAWRPPKISTRFGQIFD